MHTRRILARTAVLLAMLVASAAAAVPPADAFSFAIGVTGDGVLASGTVVFPADLGADPAGVDLILDATLFGNAVTFTEADIQSIGWAGADPGDLIALLIDNLALGVVLGANTFVLTDNGGQAGDAVCTSASSACAGADIALGTTTWAYTAQAAPVTGPSTAIALLAGLGVVVAARLMRGRLEPPVMASARARIQG